MGRAAKDTKGITTKDTKVQVDDLSNRVIWLRHRNRFVPARDPRDWATP